MSMNCIFAFSLFLLLLVVLNIYFFYILSTDRRTSNFNLPSIKSDLLPPLFREINEQLNHLPSQYYSKHTKFLQIQNRLISFFNSSTTNIPSVWHNVDNWVHDESLFPYENGVSGQLLKSLHSSQIVLVDNAPKGTQLKLLLVLEGKQKLYFKPKRYNLNDVIKGDIYGGFDRHNSEVFAYYLAMVLNYKWVVPSAVRKINFDKEIIPHATLGLRKTMVKNGDGPLCIYGKCFYCKLNVTVCPDSKGYIEGAAILYLDKQLTVHKSPWRRSYTNKKMKWEDDHDYCKKVSTILSAKRILNLIDIAIIDFLIQNGDRHRYEVYKEKIILLDNGKGLGNPMVDEMDILAPLYQCCTLSASTWEILELVSGGSLTETIKLLASLQGEKLATDDHYRAVERRLLKEHQLNFMRYSDHWRGTSATIVPTKNFHVWGAIWRLHDNDLPALDKQEGVDTNWYFAKNVDIQCEDGSFVSCRTYQQTVNPPPRERGEELPLESRPSVTYVDCIVSGAVECQLPEYYIEELKKIPNNEQEASPKMIEKLKSSC